MAVLPGVLGCRTLRRTIRVRLGSNPLRSALGGFMKYPGYQKAPIQRSATVPGIFRALSSSGLLFERFPDRWP